MLRTWVLLQKKVQVSQGLTLPDEIDTLVQTVYEEAVDMPESLWERLEQSMMEEDGEVFTHRNQANQAIIGFPDDASWNDPARFVLYDDDESGVHRTLMAQTRLGEDSVVIVPITPEETFSSEVTPEFANAKQWYLRAMSLSRKSVVKKLQAQGVPEGWKKSPLLRNCYPFQLDAEGRWLEESSIRLDNDLGLVYEPKEAE